mgnify:CR=1 FL=1
MQHKWLRKRSRLILVSVVLLFFLVGCRVSPTVQIHGIDISVEIADTPQEREQGLMFRDELCERCGMLFIFEEEGKQIFWMKNTLIPLDIIFIDRNSAITDIVQAEPCAQDPCETYTPTSDSPYVLEVNKGFSEQHHLQKGDVVTLPFYSN